MPTQVRQKGVERSYFFRQALIFAGLTCLTFQAGELAFHFSRNFRQALKICFRAIQFQLSFMTARVQACNTGCFFQNATAILGLGPDQFRYLALTDKRRRVCPGGCVCK